MIKPIATFCAALLLSAAMVQHAAAQQPCESLKALQLPHVTITAAAVVPEASFKPPRAMEPVIVPAHCEVKGVSKPTSDSEIKFEVWMPVAGWNGKYEQVGNGGWAGAIPTPSLADALRRGFATAGTDDGHTGGSNAIWAMGHPEKLIDFGYRAVHETSVSARQVIRAFYGTDSSRAYFAGCSDGGREALMEAERYPDDFIGIVAGAPANFWTHLLAGAVWNAQALVETPDSFIPPAKLPAIQKAVLAACDAVDGVKDQLIEDPRQCKFDPEVLKCKGADSADCLTEPQIIALRKIYDGPKNPRTGEQIMPGFMPGTEAAMGAWSVWITGGSPEHSLQFMFGHTYYADTVFENLKWDYRSLNFDSDLKTADAKTAPILNAMSPDLRAFKARGGKLIQYHGWGDAAIPPLSSTNYYDQVEHFFSALGGGKKGNVRDFYRLFMVPGMGHCAGGPGANSFGNAGVMPDRNDPDHDVVAALDRWVEEGVAPDKIIATGFVDGSPAKGVAMTRPLCAYPLVARYKGSGSTDDAANFDCVAQTPARKH
ncbi:MAG TPA: tannase/feruloyl esterase family alpha/beta hydrolase [Blastocatellia bacterium]|nr:tannase/feruloyl esterase family alpha/beta hydrolase [Blastocatellia bacterium]